MLYKIFDKHFFDAALPEDKHEALTPIENPNGENETTGRPVWLQTVLDNHSNTNLFFVGGDLPTCEAKYWKFQYSDQQVEGIGNLAQYRIGSIVEMTEQEKEAVDYVAPQPDPYETKRQANLAFGRSLQNLIIRTGNGLGFSSEKTAKINEILLNADNLMTDSAKGFIDSGRAYILDIPVNEHFTQEFKDYLLDIIDDAFFQEQWFVLPQNN